MKFIISSGCPFAERVEIIDADSHRQAYARAVEQTRCAGADITDPDVLSDTTWAEEYTVDRAYDLGLIHDPLDQIYYRRLSEAWKPVLRDKGYRFRADQE